MNLQSIFMQEQLETIYLNILADLLVLQAASLLDARSLLANIKSAILVNPTLVEYLQSYKDKEDP